MTTHFTGIENVQEFYTHHYLTAIMEGELKRNLVPRWRQQAEKDGKSTPEAALRRVARPFFKFRNDLERERDQRQRSDLHRGFFTELLHALGYEPLAGHAPNAVVPLPQGPLPLLAHVRRHDGAPLVWCIPALAADDWATGTAARATDAAPRPSPSASPLDLAGAPADPLDCRIQPWQLPPAHELPLAVQNLSLEELLNQQIFNLPEPPRFILLCGLEQLLLLDRSKWPEKHILRFHLPEILGRREPETLRATAALLHRQSLAPRDGLCLLDGLDESSHRHAHGVSQDLKYALREAIELLGNEAVYYWREVRKQRLDEHKLGQDLGRECLRVMYRLLFLFYLEARPELGYAPMGEETYRKGYSLESLRRLELVELTTDEARNGTYFHQSIALLFRLVYRGTRENRQLALSDDAAPLHKTFHLDPLRSHLFDPRKNEILEAVTIRNFVWQRIIELLSLSRPDSRKNRRRGRISYAQLGINQLGAVYEALLSYRGFFAKTDLYEVQPARGTTNAKHDPLGPAYFVSRRELEKYAETERVYNDDGSFKRYPKGSFIYRMAGRDRQESASFYTPEPLTRCLVHYALDELLHNEKHRPATAQEILRITLCEPAMGSAAFLGEAIDQLAEIYLQRRQKELDRTIPLEDYAHEKQKVKMFLADNNVFGVDLNPTAVELAQVSLWLNTIHQGAYVHWFRLQLKCGNSLIGAGRRFVDPENPHAPAAPQPPATAPHVKPGRHLAPQRLASVNEPAQPLRLVHRQRVHGIDQDRLDPRQTQILQAMRQDRQQKRLRLPATRPRRHQGVPLGPPRKPLENPFLMQVRRKAKRNPGKITRPPRPLAKGQPKREVGSLKQLSRLIQKIADEPRKLRRAGPETGLQEVAHPLAKLGNKNGRKHGPPRKTVSGTKARLTKSRQGAKRKHPPPSKPSSGTPPGQMRPKHPPPSKPSSGTPPGQMRPKTLFSFRVEFRSRRRLSGRPPGLGHGTGHPKKARSAQRCGSRELAPWRGCMARLLLCGARSQHAVTLHSRTQFFVRCAGPIKLSCFCFTIFFAETVAPASCRCSALRAERSREGGPPQQ